MLLVGLCAPVAAALFTIDRFEVVGEHPLSESETNAILEPFLGPQETISGVENAAAALEKRIKASGSYFHRVIVPPQRATEGIFKLEVISFAVEEISIEGNEHFDETNILRSLSALQQGQAPNSLEIARSLQLSNLHSARRVAVFMREGEGGGHLAAQVKVRDSKPSVFFGSMSNTGDERTGYSRVSMGFQHSNLFNRDHALTLSYTTSPENLSGVKQYGLFYRLPIYRIGGELSGYYTHSDVDQGRIADAFDVSGAGDFGGLSYKHILRPRGNYSHTISMSIDDRLFENNTLFAGQPLGVDVRSRPLAFQYSGRFESGANRGSFYIQRSMNLRSGKHNNDLAYSANRFGADERWATLRFGGDVNYALPRDWVFKGRFRGQYSSDLLISGEQFGLGGSQSIRGFEERELSSDKGVQASAEIYTPPLIFNTQLLAFLDAGLLTPSGGDTSGEGGEALASIGAGMRWFWRGHIGVSFDAAYVLEGNNRRFGDDRTRANTFDFHGNIFLRY